MARYLALIGPAFNALNYAAEGMVDDAAHTVSVFPTPPQPTAPSSTDADSTGHRYTLVPSDQVPDWAAADEYCRNDGGYLAHIDSPSENDLVYRIMTDQGVESAYFGFTDAAAEGVWNWSHGEPSAYTNWAANEPNAESPLEDYAMFYWQYPDGTWNDGDFTADSTDQDGTAFLCEYSS